MSIVLTTIYWLCPVVAIFIWIRQNKGKDIAKLQQYKCFCKNLTFATVPMIVICLVDNVSKGFSNFHFEPDDPMGIGTIANILTIFAIPVMILFIIGLTVLIHLILPSVLWFIYLIAHYITKKKNNEIQ